jgi:hypothetical protein
LNNLFANLLIIVLFSNVYCLLSPVLYYSFFAHQKLYWQLGVIIACHCDLISIPAFFGSGNVAPASFPKNNIKKGRWTQDKHKIFIQEYEKYGNNCMQIAKVFSTQTPAQMKKNAECFFKQNLKTNSAAVKQYQESLSPNGKVQVLVNDFAAHQKQQQSLSPENKVQMLSKDADAHRKQCESLPPEKKVKILESDAAAHKKQQESLSLDDKVQILKKDADAHKKKCESLSPEDKDLFVKNNTAEQHKHCTFLCSEQQSQVLTINAAAHKKLWKSLSPEQNSQVLLIDAAAHKNNMSCFPLRKK